MYKDRDWLYMMYWIKNLSLRQIAKLVEVDNKTIRNWLAKFLVSTRHCSTGKHLAQANHCQLSQEAKEWINGELLGDGSISSQSSYSANFQYSSKYLEYAQYVSDILLSFGIEQSGKIKEYYLYRSHKYQKYAYYRYVSRDYVELLPVKKQWYPGGNKIIPKNIKLTSLVCRQWYIGDGSLMHKKDYNPFIVLATCGFPIDDVAWLVERLKDLGFKVTKRNYNNTIGISTHSTQEFLAYIGECPVECYKYKWNYRRNTLNPA